MATRIFEFKKRKPREINSLEEYVVLDPYYRINALAYLNKDELNNLLYYILEELHGND